MRSVTIRSLDYFLSTVYINCSDTDSTSVLPSLPPSEGSIHYRLLLDPDGVNVDHVTMECVVVTLRLSVYSYFRKELVFFGVVNLANHETL